jgi:hypothetical protein
MDELLLNLTAVVPETPTGQLNFLCGTNIELLVSKPVSSTLFFILRNLDRCPFLCVKK